MMSVSEYAIDINKTVGEILKKCKELDIIANNKDDLLDDEAIILLDSSFQDGSDIEEELDNIVDEIIENKKIDLDNTISKQKLKKKSEVSKSPKKDFAIQKKEMYKNKEKLMSNKHQDDDKIVLYTENMTIGDLATNLGIASAEIIKKLNRIEYIATNQKTQKEQMSLWHLLFLFYALNPSLFSPACRGVSLPSKTNFASVFCGIVTSKLTAPFSFL